MTFSSRAFSELTFQVAILTLPPRLHSTAAWRPVDGQTRTNEVPEECMGSRTAAAVLVAVVMTTFAGDAQESPSSPPPQPPTLDELRSATYTGLEGLTKPVTLVDGKWEDTAKRVAVTLAHDFRVLGDLDGAAPDEAVVILTENRGGTGTVSYLAVVARRAGRLVNVATAPVGDRVQLRDVRIEKHRIVADVEIG